jgi:hypothetical protein
MRRSTFRPTFTKGSNGCGRLSRIARGPLPQQRSSGHRGIYHPPGTRRCQSSSRLLSRELPRWFPKCVGNGTEPSCDFGWPADPDRSASSPDRRNHGLSKFLELLQLRIKRKQTFLKIGHQNPSSFIVGNARAPIDLGRPRPDGANRSLLSSLDWSRNPVHVGTGGKIFRLALRNGEYVVTSGNEGWVLGGPSSRARRRMCRGAA